MWNRRSVWLVMAAAAVAIFSLNMLGAIGGRENPSGQTRRVIGMHLHHDLAEITALGGEPIPDNSDFYEICAAPAECHCWTGPRAVVGARRDDAARDSRGTDNDASMCRVIRPWWTRLWRTVSP